MISANCLETEKIKVTNFFNLYMGLVEILERKSGAAPIPLAQVYNID